MVKYACCDKYESVLLFGHSESFLNLVKRLPAAIPYALDFTIYSIYVLNQSLGNL
jgi:hypothetical protein